MIFIFALINSFLQLKLHSKTDFFQWNRCKVNHRTCFIWKNKSLINHQKHHEKMLMMMIKLPTLINAHFKMVEKIWKITFRCHHKTNWMCMLHNKLIILTFCYIHKFMTNEKVFLKFFHSSQSSPCSNLKFFLENFQIQSSVGLIF